MKKLLIGLLALGSISSFAQSNDSIKDSLKKARKTIQQAHECQILERDGYAVIIDNQCVDGIVKSAFSILEAESRLPEDVIENIKQAYYGGGKDTQQESTNIGEIYTYSLRKRLTDSESRYRGEKYRLTSVDKVLKALQSMY